MRAIALIIALALTACEPVPVDAPPPGAFPETEPAIAIVDGHIIPASVVDAITGGLSDEEREQFENSPQYAEFQDGLVTQEVLYRKALAAGAHESDSAHLLVALAAREAIVRAYMEQVGDDAITDEAIAKEYEDRAVEFRREEARASHIMVRDMALAERLKTELDAGADFTALAAEHSIDPGSKDKGGDLGWFQRERMLPAVADAAFAGAEGNIIGPIESSAGIHIVRIDGKRDARPMDEVRPQLEEALKATALDQFVKDAKEAADIRYPTDGADGMGADGMGADGTGADAAAPGGAEQGAAGDHGPGDGHGH